MMKHIQQLFTTQIFLAMNMYPFRFSDVIMNICFFVTCCEAIKGNKKKFVWSFSFANVVVEEKKKKAKGTKVHLR